ncbi:MAG: rRNA maturation RNase YbeY [Alphaproteobacteria bacterium]|jgi:probable rRNA maturation factor|nr:rRNA maturation RNase YbeY [Alphaproteobacteria bacterium]
MSDEQTIVLVEIVDARWRAADIPEPEDMIDGAVRAALAACEYAAAVEVGVRLTSDAEIRELNRDWRGQDKATNVLSFALDDEGLSGLPVIPLGDVVLAFDTCAREAAEENKPIAHHLSHLVVHGTLHLLGYDHEVAEDAELMEATEQRILQGLGVPDPYAGSVAA